LLDITIPISRIYETFIGNNHVEPKKVRKMKPTIQAGRGTSAIKNAKPKKIVHETFAKPPKPTLPQKQMIWAICMKLYANKALANDIAKLPKTRDSASSKIAELLKIQESRRKAQ
jgi:hypothetical protein